MLFFLNYHYMVYRFLVYVICMSVTMVSAAQMATKPQAVVLSSAELWKTLAMVEYSNVPDRYFPLPVFNKTIKDLEGKRLTIKGFIIPLEENKKQLNFMLSMVPFSHCYFCGGSGPESIIEVNATIAFDYTSKPVEVTGILKLNSIDENHLFYILENATPIL